MNRPDPLELLTGTIVVISEDRHFVSDVATQVAPLRPREIPAFGGASEEGYMRK